MAKDVDAVEGLLEELRVAAFPAAERELDDLKALAVSYTHLTLPTNREV